MGLNQLQIQSHLVKLQLNIDYHRQI
jgi:hypothetical protein